MLKIIQSMSQLNFSQLMEIYEESNILAGQESYPMLSYYSGIREAEQDFYDYLSSIFFRQDNSFYAVWLENGVYVSALRLEPYRKHLLLCALETAPHMRRKGYACKLLRAVIDYLMKQGSGIIYSHVSKHNVGSLNAHLKCGFKIIQNHAVYSDGSVLPNSYTLSFEYKKTET